MTPKPSLQENTERNKAGIQQEEKEHRMHKLIETKQYALVITKKVQSAPRIA